MERPDGITQEAWDAAEQALSSPVWFDGEESPLHEAIARAIQSAVEAERERCADYVVRRAAEMYASATMTGQTMARIFEAEAAAIRKGA